MTTLAAETVLFEELARIAPEIDVADIDRQGDLREQFDIDSMDFLNLITALSQRLNKPMPEEDFPKMQSINAMLAYLRDACVDST